MEKVKKILMISTITVVFAIMPVFGAKKQGVTIYKQSDLVKQQVNIYTPAAYQSGNAVRSGLGIKGDVIELVVDYSGSMDSWIKLAISTLRGILPKISPETNVGLRVFGQDTGQPFISVMFNSCKATEQVVRPAQKNSASVINGLNKTKIGYATPLTYALKRTVYGDFAGIAHSTKKKIVLVTDGGESCNEDPCAFIRSVMAQRKDVVVDVIMVNGGNNLRCLADATSGKYYNINDASQFGTAMGVSFETLPADSFKNTQPSTGHQQGVGDGYHYEYVK